MRFRAKTRPPLLPPPPFQAPAQDVVDSAIPAEHDGAPRQATAGSVRKQNKRGRGTPLRCTPCVQNHRAGAVVGIHKRERDERSSGGHAYGVRHVEFQGDDGAGGHLWEFHDEEAAGDVGAVNFALERAE